MKPAVLIPVKSLAGGKSRLAPLLDPEARRELNGAFMQHAIAVAASYAGASRCAVVSSCEEVLAVAQLSGVQAIRQTRPGLNTGLAQGFAQLQRHGPTDVLIVPCDTPRLHARDLEQVVKEGSAQHAVVICPDRIGLGTNMLYIPAGIVMRFRFGKQSLAKHVDEARRAGATPLVLANERIAFDVDTPADLNEWMGSAELGERIRLTGQTQALAAG